MPNGHIRDSFGPGLLDFIIKLAQEQILNKGGTVCLPFEEYIIRQPAKATRDKKKNFNNIFAVNFLLKKNGLQDNSLWLGTQAVAGSMMQTRFQKALDQEETTCAPRTKSMTVNLRGELDTIGLGSMEDEAISDVRFIQLRSKQSPQIPSTQEQGI